MKLSTQPRARSLGIGLLAALLPFALACSDSTTGTQGGMGDDLIVSGLQCDLDPAFLADGGVGRDGIPSLQNPEWVSAEPQPANDYLLERDRVVGLVLNGTPFAVPHNVLWWHEIVNMEEGSEQVAITYCPLTGSSIGFDRSSIGGDELGVSGVLFMNNLIMFNRGDPEALWPQMMREARCGPLTGDRLEHTPVFEMTWEGWKDLYPGTRVVSSETGFARDYRQYPYGNYESFSNQQFLFQNQMPPPDTRRNAKERILGLPPEGGEPGNAFPFGALRSQPGEWTVVETEYQGEPAVVFWSTAADGAMAFRPRVNGSQGSFEVTEEGIVDVETGTLWDVTGRALEGPLQGQRLPPVEEAYVAFWGAWAAFHPDPRLWTGE